MKKIRCIALLIFVNSVYSFAAENHLAGSRALALSNAVVSFSDTWSTFHNQAGLAEMNYFSAGFYYESKFNIDELSLVAGSFVLPIRAGTFGIRFFQFGKGTLKGTENRFWFC